MRQSASVDGGMMRVARGDERKKCVQNSGRDFRRPVTIVSKAAQPNEQLIDFIWFIFIYIILLTIIII